MDPKPLDQIIDPATGQPAVSDGTGTTMPAAPDAYEATDGTDGAGSWVKTALRGLVRNASGAAQVLGEMNQRLAALASRDNWLKKQVELKAATGHTHTKSEVGLANVDNTSDASKPVSTAAQTALDGVAATAAADATTKANAAQAAAAADATTKANAAQAAAAADATTKANAAQAAAEAAAAADATTKANAAQDAARNHIAVRNRTADFQLPESFPGVITLPGSLIMRGITLVNEQFQIMRTGFYRLQCKVRLRIDGDPGSTKNYYLRLVLVPSGEIFNQTHWDNPGLAFRQASGQNLAPGTYDIDLTERSEYFSAGYQLVLAGQQGNGTATVFATGGSTFDTVVILAEMASL